MSESESWYKVEMRGDHAVVLKHTENDGRSFLRRGAQAIDTIVDLTKLSAEDRKEMEAELACLGYSILPPHVLLLF